MAEQSGFGAYGDPAFVPVDVWRRITARASAWTGYSHQWRKAEQLKDLVMASVDSAEEQIEAVSRGWRTFRMKLNGQSKFKDEVVCPASNEAGHKTTCLDCQLCRGRSVQAKSVVINAHGSGAVHYE